MKYKFYGVQVIVHLYFHNKSMWRNSQYIRGMAVEYKHYMNGSTCTSLLA